MFTKHFLPSDHAPVSLELSLPGNDIDRLVVRAGHLGEQYVPSLAPQRKLTKKPVKWCSIDRDVFVEKLSSITLDNNFVYVNDVSNNVVEVIYECSQASKKHDAENGNVITAVDRWDRLLQDRDDPRVWLEGKVPR